MTCEDCKKTYNEQNNTTIQHTSSSQDNYRYGLVGECVISKESISKELTQEDTQVHEIHSGQDGEDTVQVGVDSYVISNEFQTQNDIRYGPGGKDPESGRYGLVAAGEELKHTFAQTKGNCLEIVDKVPVHDHNKKIDFTYYGETSRPARMRAFEHFKNLEDFKLDSFMLTHWLLEHKLQMTPPDFKFEVIRSFGDSLSRQIAEAVYIEQGGNLNRKSEFGHNHLYRLEARATDWELEQEVAREAVEKANLKSNLQCFINVIKSVNKRCIENDEIENDQCYNYRYKLKRKERGIQSPTAELHQVPKKRRRGNMDTSTPLWSHRQSRETLEGSPSPIRTSPALKLNGSSFNGNSSGSFEQKSVKNETITIRPAGLSPNLRRLLIDPTRDDSFEDMRKVLNQTVALTKAAMVRGLIPHDANAPELTEPLEENPLYKPLNITRNYTLSKLLEGLNIQEWDEDDFVTEYDFLKASGSRHRRGVLVADNVPNGGFVTWTWMNALDNGIALPAWEDEFLRFPGLGKFQQEKTPAKDNIEKESSHVESSINQSLRGTVTSQRKRKETSPRMEQSSNVVLRLKRNDNSSSPILRPRPVINKSPQGAQPPSGGVSKQKRVRKTPRRKLVPGLKQQLITSSFSPRPHPEKDLDLKK